MNRRTLFISDLHLDESQPQITQAFLRLLKQCEESTDALYILGDLFEVWVGDDHHDPFYQSVIIALRHLTERGIPVYFLPGNRDFLIGRLFLEQTGCLLLADEEKHSIYQTPVLLMHGDTLCTQDVAYLKARRFTHHPIVQKCFLWLPQAIRKKIANRLRAASQRHTQTISLAMMDVTQAAVEKVMNKQGTDWLIHGHTHRPKTHRWQSSKGIATRFVLGAWHEEANMLIWYACGKKEWVSYPLTSAFLRG